MTNPNLAVGTNAAYNGRTSVQAVNDVLAAYSGRGVVSGWRAEPNTGLTIQIGGEYEVRDVAIAEDDTGNRTTINNISKQPILVPLATADASNSRIDAIVAYVENPPRVDTTSRDVDNPQVCGIIAVEGVAAVSPEAPDENAIRTAITADGASGSTAYYAVLCTVNVSAGATDLSTDDIARGQKVGTFGEFHTFEIPAAAWAGVQDASPYKVATVVMSETGISDDTVVELLNDQAVLFANYGFAIGNITGRMITIYALSAPTEPISLTVSVRG